ncbi:MAG TPA: trypsin-like serine protease [Pirellulales bacterium]|jgi:hypothetical protein|nr:trypsin-like serine protease [Pirellulales bacterium]
MRSVGGVRATFFSPAAFGPLAAFASLAGVRRLAMVCFAVLGLLTSRAAAVVIVNINGTADNGQNSMVGTPSPPSFYDSVGIRGANQASVVYLGNDWAITNNHVAVIPGDPNYGFVQLYNQNTHQYEQFQAASTTQIYNGNNVLPATLDGSATDLKLIHLAANPDLASVQAATMTTSNPSSGQTITMIGAGMDLGTVQGTFGHYTYYNLMDNDNVPRWGTNDIYSVGSSLQPVGATYNYELTNWFNSPSGSNQEALETYGDSGGGVFNQSGVLIGLMDNDAGPLSVLSAQNPTGFDYNTDAYVGEESLMINLYPYQATIAADIAATPEPSGLVLGGLGAGMALLAALRARRTSPRRLPSAVPKHHGKVALASDPRAVGENATGKIIF